MPELIQDEVERMGPLRSSAQLIVDYVHAVSPGSRFNGYTEWTLEPDNWVTIRFAHIRAYTIALTLGVRLSLLPNDTGLKMDNRRQWSRIYVRRVAEMPAAMECLRIAFLRSSNRHRKLNGEPEDPVVAAGPATWSRAS